MSLNYRQQYQLHLIETHLLRSDSRLARMLGMFGRLSADQPMPSWEQVSSRQDDIRQAAALLAEAVTVVAAALSVLFRAALALVTAVVRGERIRPPAPQYSRPRPPGGRPEADGLPAHGRVTGRKPRRNVADNRPRTSNLDEKRRE